MIEETSHQANYAGIGPGKRSLNHVAEEIASSAIGGEDLSEVGADKELSQHIGNIGFGASSIAQVTKTITRMVSKVRPLRLVPGVNLGVAFIESYNAAKKLKDKEPIVAASSAGNAAGCLGAFIEEAGAASIITGRMGNRGRLFNMGVVFGIIGGGLGIAAGTAEIRRGLKIKRAGGSNRTLTMGVLDISSGVASLVGTALAGMGSPIGIPLMITSGLCDIAGIAVDYFGHRLSNRSRTKSEIQSPKQVANHKRQS